MPEMDVVFVGNTPTRTEDKQPMTSDAQLENCPREYPEEFHGGFAWDEMFGMENVRWNSPGAFFGGGGHSGKN